MNIEKMKKEYEGNEAIDYAEKHLKEVKVDQVKWETYYIDEKTGEKWIEFFPHGELHGGGSPHLKKVEKWVWEEEEAGSP